MDKYFESVCKTTCFRLKYRHLFNTDRYICWQGCLKESHALYMQKRLQELHTLYMPIWYKTVKLWPHFKVTHLNDLMVGIRHQCNECLNRCNWMDIFAHSATYCNSFLPASPYWNHTKWRLKARCIFLCQYCNFYQYVSQFMLTVSNIRHDL